MADRPIKLGAELSLPIDVVTEALGLVGMRGAGKTHLLCVLCEELIAARAPVAILDPLGVLWGLRASKDGKRPGLPVIVLGGEHGDVPLESTAGRVIADWVVQERRPCVIDLSNFRKAEQRRFVTDFGRRVYESNREPLHLVVDEADLFAPQRPQKDEFKMLGVFEDLVRRGRQRGIGLSLATQRPAVLHKDVLTQVGALIALRIVGPQDRKAIEEWIKHHGSDSERKTVLDSLGSLPRGTAWFWSPGWLGILKRVAIRERDTFDSSATPKVGAVKVAPKKLAPVDIEALRSRIAETIQRAEAEDPKALRARIAELEQQVSKGAAKPAAAERVEVPMFDPGAFERLLEAVTEHGAAARTALDQATIHLLNNIRGAANVYKSECMQSNGATTGLAGKARVIAQVPGHAPYVAVSKPAKASNGAAPPLSRCARAILGVVSQRGPASTTASQASILSGYSSTSSGFANALSELRTKGLIEGGREALCITPAGVAVVGPAAPLPRGQALADYWKSKLGKCERTLLQVLVDTRSSLPKADLAEVSGYSETSSGFANALSKLRTLELIEGYQQIRASEVFRG